MKFEGRMIFGFCLFFKCDKFYDANSISWRRRLTDSDH